MSERGSRANKERRDVSGGEQQSGGPARSANKSFEPTFEAASEARRYAGEVLHDWDIAIPDDVLLLVAELAANAVRHARSHFELSLRLQSGSLLVAVSDADLAPPRPADPAPTAPGGRGLLIVSALATSWGWEPLPGGKTVWAAVHAASGQSGEQP
jgi:anti-sigma regulatory factor (Ser/Thr protein kinase)